MNILDGIKVARDHNIGLVITDHMDLNYPTNVGFRFNPNEFFNEYEKFRSEDLLLGIELGMSTQCVEQNKNIIDNYNFDQVIGSQHCVGNDDVSNPYSYRNLSMDQMIKNYFGEIVNSLNTHSYIDTLGHIDYICRYAPVKDNEIYYDKYYDYIDTIINSCINNDIAMEINTRRLKDMVAFDNLKKIYSRYKELGGKYVTLGSDSHTSSSIIGNFDEGLLLCDLCKVKPIYFKNRNPEFF